jgi:hypothetical protein
MLTQRLPGMLTRPENRLPVRTGGRNPDAEFGSASNYQLSGGTNRQLSILNPTYVHPFLHHLVGRRAIHPHGLNQIARSVRNDHNLSAAALRRSRFPRACVSRDAALDCSLSTFTVTTPPA